MYQDRHFCIEKTKYLRLSELEGFKKRLHLHKLQQCEVHSSKDLTSVKISLPEKKKKMYIIEDIKS